ncbi:uncharacterized protein B0H18DRAFT_482011 [Fomitopsis serialis]|uniref:uncharacterized protein n=1 Tax=Fomitopsis serialis TaxID=139415 RepID=UPI0020080ADF|nr:uncharacterized protein B0H18DRAFT_482011 [Neoantrodia serialis]KAH9934625.1 hypothetical protein B0H18DRAFT_482011 [Neoantrodia serialis]
MTSAAFPGIDLSWLLWVPVSQPPGLSDIHHDDVDSAGYWDFGLTCTVYPDGKIPNQVNDASRAWWPGCTGNVSKWCIPTSSRTGGSINRLMSHAIHRGQTTGMRAPLSKLRSPRRSPCSQASPSLARPFGAPTKQRKHAPPNSAWVRFT